MTIPPDGHNGRRILEIAHHWYAAGELVQAFDTAMRAAAAARAMFAHETRLRLLERVLELWSRVDDHAGRLNVSRAEVLWHAVEAAHECGEIERGIQLADQALATVDVSSQVEIAAHIYERRARMRRMLGIQGATDDLNAALDILPDEPPRALRARILGYLAQRLWLEGRDDEARERLEQATDVAELVGDDYSIAHVLISRANLRAEAGEVDEAREEYTRARAIAERISIPMLTVRSYLEESSVLNDQGRDEAAAEAARKGLAAANKAGLERTLGIRIAGNLATALVSLGTWDEAIEIIDHALEAEPPRGYLTDLLVTRGKILLARGQLDRAQTDLTAAATATPNQAEALDERWPHAQLEADLHLLLGRPAEAWRAADEAIGRLDSRPLLKRRWPLLVTAARALSTLALTSQYTRSAQHEIDVSAAIQEAKSRANSWDTTTDVETACKASVRAILAAADDRASADRDAVVAWERTRRPYPLILALTNAAESAANNGDRSTATEYVRRAATIARAIGAKPALAEIESLVRRARLGGDEDVIASSEPPTDELGLTPRERQVLRLLTDGLTNRQIAAQLFISTKTASIHVSHILMKLDVTNRVEAAAIAHRLRLFEPVASPDDDGPAPVNR